MTIKLKTEALAALHAVANEFANISLLDIVNSVGHNSIYYVISNLKGGDTVSELHHRLTNRAEEFVKEFVCDENKVRSLFSGLEGLNHDKTVENLMFSELFLEKEGELSIWSSVVSDKKELEDLLVSLSNCTARDQKQITRVYVGYTGGVEAERFDTKYQAEAFKKSKDENYFREEVTLDLDSSLHNFLEDLGAGFEAEKIKLLKAVIWLYTISDKASGKLSSYSTFADEFLCNGISYKNKESWIELIETTKQLSHDDEVCIEDSVKFAAKMIKLAAKPDCFKIS